MRVLKVKVISLQYIFQVLYVLCFSRPIHQVSVYRTIGPLVITDRSKAVLFVWFSLFSCFGVSFCTVFTFCVPRLY